MSGFFPALHVRVPNIAETLLAAQNLRRGRLAELAEAGAQEDAQAFRGAAADLLPQLGTAQGPERQTLLAKLAGAGPQGANIAVPMMQQERERAEFGGLLGQIMGGGVPDLAPPSAGPSNAPGSQALRTDPTTGQQTMGGAPIPQVGPARGPASPVVGSAPPTASHGAPDVRAINATFAQRRASIMDDLNLSPEQQATALATLSAQHSAAIGAPSIPGGYRANPGVEGAFVGTPNPTGVVPGAAPGAGAARPGQPLPQGPLGGTDRPAAPMPQAAQTTPRRQGLPTPEQLFQLAASGNPRALDFVQRVAPLVAREAPNWTQATADGTVYFVNPRDPNQRISIGRSDGNNETVLTPDPNSPTGFRYVPRAQAGGLPAPAPEGYRPPTTPFGSGADGQALAYIEQLAEPVRGGTATPAQVSRYLSAVTQYQQERVSPDGSRVVPRLPPYAPGADEVARRYSVPGGVAPPAAPAPAAPVQSGGVTIPGTVMQADPPQLRPTPLPGAAGGVARPTQLSPQTAISGMLESASGLRSARTALELVARRPESFGLAAGVQNAVPGLLERTDPAGVEARAAVANLGSLVVHDRSGATVTAAEYPRLRPFIPTVGDPPEVVRTKLQRFVAEYEANLRDHYRTFGPEAGYRPVPAVEEVLRGSGAASGGPAAILEDARRAIQRGADPAAVRQRLQQNGIDPRGL